MSSPRSAALRCVLFAFVMAISPAPSAQPAPIHPDLTGEALLEALALDFSPIATFSYDRARDSLIAVVYHERAGSGPGGDSLRCRYSGLAVYVNPAGDPSTTAYAASPRFSTEHLWPQNRGATEGTPAHADLHHLVPVRQSINASRGDDPFGEVPDDEANRWWGPVDGVLSTPPPLSVRDAYGEKRNRQVGAANGGASLMEPPEAVKGDVARALFYVWTVYGPHRGALARGALDESFFASMLPTLARWDAADPPDDAERTRSSTVARWQRTENPFVVDASLGTRAFRAVPTRSEDAPLASILALSAPTPNPSSGHTTWTLTTPTHVRAVVFDALGCQATVSAQTTNSVSVDAARLVPGVYVLQVTTQDGSAVAWSRFTVVR